jgi:hypothetical protein
MPERVACEYFRGVERLLSSQSQLVGSRHSGDKGETREELLVGVLNNHLPLSVRAHRGGQILFVSDQRSTQTDIVIYSSSAPQLGQSRKALFLAEGVYAAIEVKSVFATAVLPALIQWSRSIKSAPKMLRRPGSEPKESRMSPMVAGLFAYTASSLKPKVIAERLASACTKAKLLPWEVPDFLTINESITLINASMMGSLDDLPEPPDLVVKARSGGLTFIGYERAFAFLLMVLVGEVQSPREEALNLLDYVSPRDDLQAAPNVGARAERNHCLRPGRLSGHR